MLLLLSLPLKKTITQQVLPTFLHRTGHLKTNNSLKVGYVLVQGYVHKLDCDFLQTRPPLTLFGLKHFTAFSFEKGCIAVLLLMGQLLTTDLFFFSPKYDSKWIKKNEPQ